MGIFRHTYIYYKTILKKQGNNKNLETVVASVA